MSNLEVGGKRIPSDPRAVCNLLLDLADRDVIPLTNLVLQKLLYFTYAIHLIETKSPLVSGYFEAWEYGPVHPGAYQAFKPAGGAPITFRAQRENLLSGERFPIDPVSESPVISLCNRIILSYGRTDPFRLVAIAHAPDAPWRYIVDKARTEVVFGMRIPDDVILERFKYHKVSVRPAAEVGGEIPSENTPVAAVGFGSRRAVAP